MNTNAKYTMGDDRCPVLLAASAAGRKERFSGREQGQYFDGLPEWANIPEWEKAYARGPIYQESTAKDMLAQLVMINFPEKREEIGAVIWNLYGLGYSFPEVDRILRNKYEELKGEILSERKDRKRRIRNGEYVVPRTVEEMTLLDWVKECKKLEEEARIAEEEVAAMRRDSTNREHTFPTKKNEPKKQKSLQQNIAKPAFSHESHEITTPSTSYVDKEIQERMTQFKEEIDGRNAEAGKHLEEIEQEYQIKKEQIARRRQEADGEQKLKSKTIEAARKENAEQFKAALEEIANSLDKLHGQHDLKMQQIEKHKKEFSEIFEIEKRQIEDEMQKASGNHEQEMQQINCSMVEVDARNDLAEREFDEDVALEMQEADEKIANEDEEIERLQEEIRRLQEAKTAQKEEKMSKSGGSSFLGKIANFFRWLWEKITDIIVGPRGRGR
ncbi:MAG: hypothetical protein LBI69_01225 [Puniceicoccales bacterium]|nr:hypothetical protein [Puniceicoccales bacterium]